MLSGGWGRPLPTSVGRTLEEGLETALIGVFLFFSYTGVPLVNLLSKTITWLKFLNIPKWFTNATVWSKTPKMILIKRGCHMPPDQAKVTYIPIVKFGVPLVRVQSEFSTI